MTFNVSTFVSVVVVAALFCFIGFNFARTVRFLFRFLLRMTCGIGVLTAFNTIAVAYGLCIGLNIYTCSLCGLLGLPGYILLIGTRLIC